MSGARPQRGPHAFTGAMLDRAGDGRRRDEGWVEAQRVHPAARALIAGDEGLRVEGGALVREPLATGSGAGGGAGATEAVLLGLEDAAPLWAIDFDPPPPEPRRPRLIGADGPRADAGRAAPGWIGLRDAAARLAAPEAGLAAYAAALLNWRRAHRHCANCGAPTDPAEGGTARLCATCGSSHHPRTDPVVIMLVTARDRLLLGRQPSWPPGRYSALAGFVSPGESLEEAVVREVHEEAGVAVGTPSYAGSQPWPFPASLMIGFTAPWEEGLPGGADPELQDVRWFDRDAVAEAASRDEEWDGTAPARELQLPPRLAIARRLVEGWLSL